MSVNQTPSEDAATGSELSTGPRPSSGHPTLWASVCLVVSLVAMLGSIQGLAVRHPFSDSDCHLWVTPAVLGLASLALTFWCSARYATGWRSRATFGAMAGFALPAVIFPFEGYYQSSYDIPSVPALGVVLFLIVGAWLGRQKWLSLAVAILIIMSMLGALYPPSRRQLPLSARSGDLTVTLTSFEHKQGTVFCHFEVATDPGTRLDREYDTQHIALEGHSIWGLLPVICWDPSPWPPEEMPSNRLRMSSWTFPPTWTRSWDVTVVVPRWPAAATSVAFPVPRPGQPRSRSPVTARGHGITLSVSDVRWSESATRGGVRRTESGWEQTPMPSLSFTVSYTGYPYNGSYGTELRAVDQDGNVLPIESGGWCQAHQGGATMACEFSDLSRSVKRIRVDAFRYEDRERNRVVFHFRRVRNPLL